MEGQRTQGRQVTAQGIMDRVQANSHEKLLSDVSFHGVWWSFHRELEAHLALRETAWVDTYVEVDRAALL